MSLNPCVLTIASHLSNNINFRLLSQSRGSNPRRRSAGDEDMIKQLNMFVRMRSDSGKPLSDIEILEQVNEISILFWFLNNFT